ncbi:glycoside hydrolase family 3 C-terminal domain-containing protein [Pedobacter sp. L105]|uniref:glycoside hydrolase family 3 C-terminal domain-containing protein n=1 Tax=Pedobacter sp. L105 TaxID=1641871 RepID=UPI00131C3AF7|nr:glycoside hydrolase family 3 N-terminal domain-containing protein [Pedobacter sp. L105]
MFINQTQLRNWLLPVLFISCPAFLFAQKKEVPLYKNPKAPVADRVKDLLGRMTVEEKVGQLSTLLGWEMYEKKGDGVVASEKFKKTVAANQYGMLWATLRADPWTRKTLETGLDPYKAALATNALQKYIIEHTRLQIPVLIAEECPHGHMAIGTTVFPTSIGQSSTWDPMLIQSMAAAIAKEARLQGAHIGYGPVLDLAREPRWSRVEETYGEDPFLNSMMGVAMVKGFQGKDNTIGSGVNVISTLKHFTAYGSPEGGHNAGLINPGRRELIQSYLPPFEASIKAGALSIMAAYNSVDGVPCSSNPYLLDTLLHRQWGFKGFSVSDLGSIDGLVLTQHVAANNIDAAALAMNAGLDNDLGGVVFSAPLLEAIKNGAVSMQRIDEATGRLLAMKFEMGLFENPYVDPKLARKEVRKEATVTLSRKVAQESIILLKNENAVLPLKKTISSIAVIGPNADNIYNQLGDYTAPQDPKAIITVLEGITAKLPAAKINYVKGCAIRDTANVHIAEAVAAAKQSDVAVVVIGGSSARDFKTEYISTGAAIVGKGTAEVSDMEAGEGYDRETLDLMGKQLELLQAVVKTGKPVVVVFIGGRPLNLNWPAANAAAIITAWYPGQEGGDAIADVLFGDYNPAGRLPISVPRSVGQLPDYYNYQNSSKHDYVEGPATPLYAFGYGLSYSKFVYSDLDATVNAGDNLTVNVSLKVTNSSAIDGDEVVQLYLRDDVSSVVTPVKTLKAFSRINIKAGATRTVEFTLHKNDLSLMNQQMQRVVEAGDFTLMLGAGSTDIRLEKKINVNQNYKL